MSNIIEINNQALANINANVITSLDGSSKEAKVCKLLFASLRDEVLSDFAWKEAEKVKALALTDETHPVWSYVYQYPSDCLVPRKILNTASEDKIEFSYGVSDDLNSNLIYTNEAEAYLVYTARIENTNLYGSKLISTLVLRLSAAYAKPVKGKESLGERLLMQYERMRGSAKVTSANSTYTKPKTGNSFTKARTW